MLSKLLIAAFVITGCQSFDNRPHDPKPKTEAELLFQVKAMRNRICSMSEERIRKKGFAVSRCDGLLFTSLHAIACGGPSIDVFEGEAGQWFRSPLHNCFIPPKIKNGADSSISKDMIAGLKLHTALTDNRERAKRWVAYCDKNRLAQTGGLGCQIGTAVDAAVALSKTVMPPATIKFFEDLSLRSDERQNSDTGKKPVLTGYQAHLQVLDQLAIGVAYGGISDNGVKLLKAQADRQPRNALFAGSYALYKDGNMTEPAKKLLAVCPVDRLPSSTDFCSDYLFQRDADQKDWKPCLPVIDHDGTDCAFAASVILGEVKSPLAGWLDE